MLNLPSILMIIRVLRYIPILICLLGFQPLLAQKDTLDPVKHLNPPKNRELFHDYVDKQQREMLRSDGRPDNEFRPSGDEEINYILTRAAISKIDWLQYKIEKDSLQNDQVK